MRKFHKAAHQGAQGPGDQTSLVHAAIRAHAITQGSEPRLIFSGTAAGAFLAGLAKTSSETRAIAAYRQIAGGELPHDSNLMKYQQYLAGVIEAQMFLGADRGTRAKAELESLRRGRAAADRILSESNKALEESVKALRELRSDQEANRKELSDLRTAEENSLKETLSLLGKNTDDARLGWGKEFQSLVDASQKKIVELEQLYREKLRLDGPAKYWEGISKTRARSGWWWLGGGCVASVLFMCFLLFALYLPGLDSPLSPTGVRGIINFALIVSVAAFVIRFAFKLATSDIHLSRDAKEREQLTYFYLALIKEQAVGDKEREIILQSLFSRADTGLLKSDGPTMPTTPTSNFLAMFKDRGGPQ